MQATLLPLFPLQVLVFPRTRLALHIFEERYKEMVGEAIQNHSEFGVVPVTEKGMLNAGCTVIVERVLERYPDGRLDIMTAGIRRFEIILLNQEKAYLRGEVNFFDDDDPEPAPQEVREKAIESYQRWLELGESRAIGDTELSDPQVSFQLAQGIQDLAFLQILLATRSEPKRLRKLTEFLNDYIPKRRHTAAMKRLAPLNGHGQHPVEL